MNNSIQVNCKILDKRKKEGWFFGPSFYVTCCLPSSTTGDPEKSPGNIVEYPVSINTYYKMNIGDIKSLTLYKHSNGSYYPTPEYAE